MRKQQTETSDEAPIDYAAEIAKARQQIENANWWVNSLERRNIPHTIYTYDFFGVSWGRTLKRFGAEIDERAPEFLAEDEDHLYNVHEDDGAWDGLKMPVMECFFKLQERVNQLQALMHAVIAPHMCPLNDTFGVQFTQPESDLKYLERLQDFFKRKQANVEKEAKRAAEAAARKAAIEKEKVEAAAKRKAAKLAKLLRDAEKAGFKLVK